MPRQRRSSALRWPKRTAELQRSNAELEQCASIASHDLQAPLSQVIGYINLLAKRYQDKLDANANEFLNFAVDGATRMQQLIQDLLTYSHVGHGGQACAPVNCEDILARALQNLQLAIKESDAVVTHDPLPTVPADATQLLQVFQNLLGNALKFRGDQPPTIHIGVERCNSAWRFAVCDNGIGIEPQYVERIFEIFQRLHTRREYPGTGIGLALCKKIVERPGGRIWVESQPGRGATFYFTLLERSCCPGVSRGR
jgi:light-regulated signal transduction histidine kinase (bacteriophytochrome)